MNMTGLSKEQLEMLQPGSTKRPEIPEGMFAPHRSPQDAMELAYGLLWLAPIDRTTKQGFLVYEARQALLGQLGHDAKLRGLTAARKMLESR